MSPRRGRAFAHRCAEHDRYGARRTSAMSATVICPQFISRVHGAGAQIHTWTVDQPEKVRRLFDRGVDQIMAGGAQVLNDVLEARSQWEDAV